MAIVEEQASRVDPVLLQSPSVTWRGGGNAVWRGYATTPSLHGPVSIDLTQPEVEEEDFVST
jgi:hypothetical protein